MSDFRVVADTYRDTKKNPEYEALRQGQTVFVPTNGADPHKVANRIRTAMRRTDGSIRTRVRVIDGEKGVIAWMDR